MKISKSKIPRLAELLFKFEGDNILLYPYQKKFLLDDSHFRIIMKARQLGMSWVIALEGLIAALTRPYQTILFVSSGEEAAKRVLQYVYSFLHGMPIRPRLLTHSLTECRFLNQSRIISLPNNDRTVRGYRAHKVYCDEFAALMNDNEILAAIQPSISRGGDLTILSTPRGRANRFWDIWDDDNSGYKRHRISWEECPDKEYHRMVKRMQRTMLDLDFRQEYCCFTDKTLINAADGYRSIASINIGDIVLTHEGRYKEVKNTFNRDYNGQLIEIITWMNSAFPIVCTPEHPILCETGFKQAKDILNSDKIIYHFNTEEQNHVIRKQDFVRKYNYGFRSKWFKKIPDEIFVDEEIAELFGWYIAEGCESAKGRSIVFSLSYKEANIAKRLQDILKRRFKINSSIRCRGSVITLTSNSTILVDMCRQFGRGARNKKLPLWCKLLPKKIQNSLLTAIVSGDGYFGKNALCIVSASQELVLDIKDILLRLGYCPRIKKCDRDGGVINGRQIGRFVGYDISASYNGSSKAILTEDYIALPIRDRRFFDAQCNVYNLEVEGDNSYAIEYASVHNCDPSISDMAFFTRELLKWVINYDAHYLSELESQNKTVMGIDFGKRVSSTAITVAERCEDLVKIRFQEELRNMPYDFEVGEKSSQLRRIAAINDAFNVDEINIDATGVGVRLEEDMRRLFGAKVESIIFSSKTKEILITNFKILCEKHGIELINDAEFISQLLSLEREVLPSGNVRYKHIKSKKDDRVWSAALAVKDMASSDSSGGYLIGGEMVSAVVNRHIEDIEPVSPKHIILSRLVNANI